MTGADRHPDPERIDALLSGTLGEEDRAAIEEHAASCGSCGGEIAFLRSLRRRTGELSPEIPPRRDLWPEIRESIETEGFPGWKPARGGGIREILAAAAAVALFLAGVHLVPTRNQERMAASIPGAVPSLAPLIEGMERAGAGTGRSLRAAFKDDSVGLAPGAAAALERNLGILDEAIEETRTALWTDPDNLTLATQLAERCRQRLELLRLAARHTRPEWT
jgi:hypothetical protein